MITSNWKSIEANCKIRTVYFQSTTAICELFKPPSNFRGTLWVILHLTPSSGLKKIQTPFLISESQARRNCDIRHWKRPLSNRIVELPNENFDCWILEYFKISDRCGLINEYLKRIPKKSRSLNFIKVVLNSLLRFIEEAKCNGSVISHSYTDGPEMGSI